MDKFKLWIKDNLPGLYISKIAKDLGFSPGHLRLMINGKRPVLLDAAVKVYFYTNGEVDWKDLIDTSEFEKIRKKGEIRRKG